MVTSSGPSRSRHACSGGGIFVVVVESPYPSQAVLERLEKGVTGCNQVKIPSTGLGSIYLGSEREKFIFDRGLVAVELVESSRMSCHLGGTSTYPWHPSCEVLIPRWIRVNLRYWSELTSGAGMAVESAIQPTDQLLNELFRNMLSPGPNARD
ncbi:hypothetical protein PIB30_083377 [Stylosanthes scabra]|uniref:Uncharacterized protein n=1 Tax=Stylosanthes scabra TaxID=79078 RepID=A0ABU6TT08_9FABA|nr:hypothetical protein [Stylosanthes scabra]